MSGNEFAGTSMGQGKLLPRCYEKHPEVPLGTPGTLYGGSASFPMVKGADIYVSLQAGSHSGQPTDPWDAEGIQEIPYPIEDMHAPKNAARFKKMIAWLCTQLQAGKHVHIGCIGGHGRTGMVITAIYAQLTGEPNAIQWVRKHYCKKAVESAEQVEFLMKHYKVSHAKGYKEDLLKHLPAKGETKLIGAGRTTFGGGLKQEHGWSSLTGRKVLSIEGTTTDTRTFKPLEASRCLWKPRSS